MADSETPRPQAAVAAASWPGTPWNLPPEIARTILELCGDSWEEIMQVNRAFHDLTSQLRYREVELAAEDLHHGYLRSEMKFKLPRCLDTLANSSYNYAQYIEKFALEEVEGTGAYGRTSSCACSSYTGSYINALLPAVLAKATRIETFRWDVRIKISAPLYKILHGIETLSHITIRLPSLLLTPTHSLSSRLRHMAPLSPPLLSGFKNIKSLNILNVDNLESVPEVQACVCNLRETLEHLHLSMSIYWVIKMNIERNATGPEVQPNEAAVGYETALAWMLGFAGADSGESGAADRPDDGANMGNSDTEAIPSGDPGPSTGPSTGPSAAESSRANAVHSAEMGDEQERPNQKDQLASQACPNPKLHVKTLGLQRIRVTTSVFSRCIDMDALTSITLLDIGSQVPIWELLELQNETRPLAISSIHTNNVTAPFAKFVSKLPKLYQIYLANSATCDNPGVEGDSNRHEPKCSLDDIRRYILKSHAASLRAISINEKVGLDWLLDSQTLILLTHRCHNLEELTVSMEALIFFEFLVLLPQFKSLVGLHIPSIHDNSPTGTVAVDAAQSILATLSHHPHMPLKYFWHDHLSPWYVNQVVRSDGRQKWLERMAEERQDYRDETYDPQTGGYDYVDDSQGFTRDDFEYQGPRYVFSVRLLFIAKVKMSIFSKDIITMSL